VEGGERADGVRMVLQTLQQPGGLLQAALPDAQVPQAVDGGVPPPRQPPVEVAGGGEELGLRLVQRPAAVRMPP